MSEEPDILPDKFDRYVYHVRSRTNRKIRYRVDLVGMGGASQCACPDWNFVAVENITKGLQWGRYAKKDPNRTCCYHTYELRIYFMNLMTKRLAQQEEKP